MYAPPSRLAKLPLALILALALALAGCSSEGGDDGKSASETTTQGDTVTTEITLDGDDVRPNGARIDMTQDQTLRLKVTSDAPGELHIHSTPEQVVEYTKGSSTHDVRFEQPGVIELESHELDKVLLQIEVR